MFAGASLDENSGAFCELKANFFRLILTKAEALKLIMLVQKKARKGDSITKIADDLVEDEIVISPIYKMVKEYPEDTEKDIYQRLN